MGEALQRDKRSEMWQKGIGIPYASTWLNGRMWEDEVVSEADRTEAGPCMAAADRLEGYEAW